MIKIIDVPCYKCGDQKRYTDALGRCRGCVTCRRVYAKKRLAANSLVVMVCSKCKQDREIGQKHPWCRSCQQQDNRRRRKMDYLGLREREKASNSASYKKRRALIETAKAQPCMDCHGQFPHYVLQFDHRDPSQKIDAVSVMVRSHVNWQIIKDEIEKCDLLCANCHATRTWNSQHPIKTMPSLDGTLD